MDRPHLVAVLGGVFFWVDNIDLLCYNDSITKGEEMKTQYLIEVKDRSLNPDLTTHFELTARSRDEAERQARRFEQRELPLKG